nr:hypothetical protein [Rhizobium subbaraonis]
MAHVVADRHADCANPFPPARAIDDLHLDIVGQTGRNAGFEVPHDRISPFRRKIADPLLEGDRLAPGSLVDRPGFIRQFDSPIGQVHHPSAELRGLPGNLDKSLVPIEILRLPASVAREGPILTEESPSDDQRCADDPEPWSGREPGDDESGDAANQYPSGEPIRCTLSESSHQDAKALASIFVFPSHGPSAVVDFNLSIVSSDPAIHERLLNFTLFKLGAAVV